jgi:hypothetical protein
MGRMNMAEIVPAAEFARNFGRYKLLAQREAVPVSSNGTLAGYFVAPHEYEELQQNCPTKRLNASHRRAWIRATITSTSFLIRNSGPHADTDA